MTDAEMPTRMPACLGRVLRDHRTGDLIMKLPRDRVAELIDNGVIAPADRTFREWRASMSFAGFGSPPTRIGFASPHG